MLFEVQPNAMSTLKMHRHNSATVETAEQAVVILVSQISPSWCYTAGLHYNALDWFELQHTFSQMHWIALRYRALQYQCVTHSSNFTRLLLDALDSLLPCTALDCTVLFPRIASHCCNSLSKHMTLLQIQCKLLFESSRAPMLQLGGAKLQQLFSYLSASILCFYIAS